MSKYRIRYRKVINRRRDTVILDVEFQSKNDSTTLKRAHFLMRRENKDAAPEDLQLEELVKVVFVKPQDQPLLHGRDTVRLPVAGY